MLRLLIGRAYATSSLLPMGRLTSTALGVSSRVPLIATRNVHWLEEDTRKKVSPQVALDRAQRFNHEGLGLYRQHKYYDAQDRLSQAIYLYKLAHEGLKSTDHAIREAIWRPLSYLALAQHGAGNFEAAQSNYDAVLEHIRTLYGPNDHRELRILSNQVNILLTMGKYVS